MKISTTLLSFGVQFAPENWMTQGVPRPYRLYYIKGGTAYFRIEKDEFPLLKDHFYLFPSSLPFLIRQDPNDRLDHIYFDFIMSPPIVASKPIACSISDNLLLPKYLELMETSAKQYMGKKNSTTNDIMSSLLEAFMSFFCTINLVKKSLDNDILKSVAYIESHYSEDIIIKDLASSLFLNEDYFIRKFKKNMGMTPYSYLSKLRLSIASGLIAQGMSLTEAAASTGYQYPSSLCHALKKNQQWDNYGIIKSLSQNKKIQK